MEEYHNIYILGTSHIAAESVKQVKTNFERIKPEIMALELDSGRLYSLRHKTKRPKNLALLRKLGLSGFVFFVLGEFIQKKLGRIVNMDPGAEMMASLKISESHNIPVALVDRDIQITLRRFSRHFRKSEGIKMVFDFILGIFRKNPLGEINLAEVPSERVIEYVLDHTKKRYPSLYKILIDERDRYMASALYHISESNPDKKILAVVGAGHVRGINRYLKQISEHKETFK